MFVWDPIRGVCGRVPQPGCLCLGHLGRAPSPPMHGRRGLLPRLHIASPYTSVFSFPETWAWLSSRIFPLPYPLISWTETREQELIVIVSSTQTTQCSTEPAGCGGDKGSTSQGCFEVNHEAVCSSMSAGRSKTVNSSIYLILASCYWLYGLYSLRIYWFVGWTNQVIYRRHLLIEELSWSTHLTDYWSIDFCNVILLNNINNCYLQM